MRIAVAGGTGVVGRRVVEAIRARGHQAIVLARSTGVDVTTGAGLAAALEGATSVVDVTSIGTTSARASRDFFRAATRALLEAERLAGVEHHVALSTVGASTIDAGYYAGKALQERLVQESTTAWTILRATQFFEFAEQLIARTSLGPVLAVPRMRSQPIAAAEVGTRLAEIAAGPSLTMARELAGPEVLEMPDLVRRVLAADGRRGRVVPVALPGAFGRGIRDGRILPSADALVGSQRFDDWLAARTRPSET